uniref:Triokinase/FMN cyclase n=2 Tax=Clastoptera arizonana TaxID=38151 RepID=A0A1B6D265_9HEMI
MSVGKKLLNSPETCVDEMLHGVEVLYPSLSVNTKARIVMINKGRKKSGQVGLLSGGGSGHEPFCSGYVGNGMLTAAVAGSVFASPPPQNIISAIRNVAAVCDGGVVVFIMNYTGDILNFGLATETARKEGYNVESFVFGEDCSRKDPGIVGKRGMCGSVLLFKICGALAEEGKTMKEILSAAEKLTSNMATLGVCLSACSLPGSPPLFSISDDSLQVGVGIHGEAGTDSMKMCSANEVIKKLLHRISEALNIAKGDEVAVLLNNLGATSNLELGIVANEVYNQLGEKGVNVNRLYSGGLMTSLDMAGVQITILKTKNNPEWVQYLDSSTEAYAWPGKPLSILSNKNEIIVEAETEIPNAGVKYSEKQVKVLKQCLISMSQSIIASEQKLNLLDSGCGDGDTGTTLRRLGEAIIQNIDNIQLSYPSSCMRRLARLAEDVVGGTSGAIYSLLFIGAASDIPDWGAACKSSINMIMKYSVARVGHRTMMDALIPAAERFEREVSSGTSWKKALDLAVSEADAGCKKTLSMKAKCGRASYVDSSNLKDVDAGAYAVVVWLQALQKELSNV